MVKIGQIIEPSIGPTENLHRQLLAIATLQPPLRVDAVRTLLLSFQHVLRQCTVYMSTLSQYLLIAMSGYCFKEV